MNHDRILLEGMAGLFAGERYLLGPGVSVVVGRSRSCDASVTRTQAYQRIGGRVLNQSRGFLRMSRRHFEVVFESDQLIRIRDLSTNGIEVDGHRVRETVFTLEDLADHAVVIRFAEGETMHVACADPGRADASAQRRLQESSPSSGFRT